MGDAWVSTQIPGLVRLKALISMTDEEYKALPVKEKMRTYRTDLFGWDKPDTPNVIVGMTKLREVYAIHDAWWDLDPSADVMQNLRNGKAVCRICKHHDGKAGAIELSMHGMRRHAVAVVHKQLVAKQKKAIDRHQKAHNSRQLMLAEMPVADAPHFVDLDALTLAVGKHEVERQNDGRSRKL
jgi:hypothetical protein